MLRPDTPLKAAVWYGAATVALTWPLAAGLGRDVPSDLGDPLLNCWILAWNAAHLQRLLRGDVGALSDVWHANIFHPAPYTLAYSELLATQSVLAFPVQAATGNIVLAYNLLFLAAFVLSGVGMFLFARAVTGDWRAAFVAGLAFAFTPYRVHQAPHLQVMWSCWMPFVLYGLRRFFDLSRERRGRAALALAGAVAALVAQNLSCGYYMFFFAPFVAAYAIYELWARRRLREPGTWLALGLAGAGALLLTVPFMWGYLALRGLGQEERGLGQVAWFSADTLGYLTAHHGSNVWGWLQTHPRPEGHLFPGLTPVLLTLVGAAAAVQLGVQAARAVPPAGTMLRRWAARLASGIALIYLALCFGLFFGIEGRYELGFLEIRLFSVSRVAAIAAGAVVLAAALSPRVRTFLGVAGRHPATFAVGAALLAFWLSLGPEARVGGDALRHATVYWWLYENVPGLDSLRVPARFAMIVMLALAAGSAYGAATLARRAGPLVLPTAALLLLLEGAALPLPVNGLAQTDDHIPPPTTVPTAPTPLTRAIDVLPRDAVLLMFPFGDIAWEIQYVYLSTFHWRRMVNGYSGGFPGHYIRLRNLLADLPEDRPAGAWPMIRDSGATHLVVLAAPYTADRLAQLRSYLEGHGARVVTVVGQDVIYELGAP